MPRRRAAPPLPEPLQRLVDRLEGVLRFEERYVEQVKDYTQRVGDLTSARSVDPGEWIENYALFLSRVVRDFGDWVLDRQSMLTEELPLVRADRGRPRKRKRRIYRVAMLPVPVRRGKLRVKEGTTGVPLYVPPAVYAGRRGRKGGSPTVTLMTDGLLPEGGGVPLSRNNVVFVPEKVPASRPEAELKITDVGGALQQNSTYRGFVWVKETKHVIAAVEVKVL